MRKMHKKTEDRFRDLPVMGANVLETETGLPIPSCKCIINLGTIPRSKGIFMNIKEASLATGISRDMIRFYEKKGLVKPERRENGYRDYSDHDLFMLVMARQYSDIGIPLDSISSMMNNHDLEQFKADIDTAIAELEKERMWIDQRLTFANDFRAIFKMYEEHREYVTGDSKPFYFYPRLDAPLFADLYGYSCSRSCLRMKYDDLAKGDFSYDMGKLFLRRVETPLKFEAYPSTPYYRVVRIIHNHSDDVDRAMNDVIAEMKKNGFEPAGDAFLFMLTGNPEPGSATVSCIMIHYRKIGAEEV